MSAQAGPITEPVPAAPTGASVSEATKVDAIPTPKLKWHRCYGSAQCATAKVPQDYDQPRGTKITIALLRLRAKDRKHRIGSLFVNPGGPGASATDFAASAEYLLSDDLRRRFDIVGMDPRGIGASQHVTCLTARTQAAALKGYAEAYPLGAQQERAWIASDRALGQACSATTLARSMSTAEVARDMELMRRAVGDTKLSYLGFSYGSYLGQVYASMFPNRFRAIAVDGVLDPVAWAGTRATANRPLDARLDSAAGAWKALHEILLRCDRAGGSRCRFALGDPVANLSLIAKRLRATPLVIVEEEEGETFTMTYPDLVGYLLSLLYDPAGYLPITDLLADLYELTEPPNPSARGDAARSRARRDLVRLHRVLERSARPGPAPTDRRAGKEYDNSLDANAAVTCTDSAETVTGSQLHGLAVKADRRARYFGRAWLWSTTVCAGDAFPGQDEDAYSGPFDVRTAAPVLYVGDYYDPATNYRGAVSASKRMPNSRLLSSDSFGHTAYGTSDCTTEAVDRYLLKVALPKEGTVCVGDVQPFDSDEADLRTNARRQRAFAGTH